MPTLENSRSFSCIRAPTLPQSPPSLNVNSMAKN